MSDNNHTQPAHQTYTAEQLAMLDNSVVPTLDIHQPLALDPSYISSTKVWHEMNNQSLPKQNATMSLNIIESLTEKYLDARHQFNLSMVDTINEAIGSETMTACLNYENELGIEDGEDNFALSVFGGKSGLLMYQLNRHLHESISMGKTIGYVSSECFFPNDNDHEGILDIHSGYGFDFDTPEFEAHRKKYFEENPNTTSYPADHFDKLLSGELDGSAKDNPFVEPVSPDIKENKDD